MDGSDHIHLRGKQVMILIDHYYIILNNKRDMCKVGVFLFEE